MFFNLRWLGEPNFVSACTLQPTVCGLRMIRLRMVSDIAEFGRVAGHYSVAAYWATDAVTSFR